MVVELAKRPAVAREASIQVEYRYAMRRGFEVFLHGSVDKAVLAIDRSLRRAKGIFEFSNEDDCILRISVIAAETHILLPDGSQLRPEDPIVDLHIWNERMPSLVQFHSSLSWGAVFRTRLQASLALLADYMTSDPELEGVKACRARVAFLRDRRHQIAARHLGFVTAVPDHSIPGYVHEFLEAFLVYGLTWVFNPDALPRKACLPQRSYLWMSTKELFRRYGNRPSAQAAAMIQARDENAGAT